MSRQMDYSNCPKCRISWKDKDGYGENMHGLEYSYDMPEHYDGVSEWVCNSCGYREGRWSGKELKEGELELRYGREE